MKYIYKTIRITAWLLVFTTFFVLLFGFLALKPFITHHISPNLSMYLHNIFLPLVFLPLFFLHSLCGTFILIQRQQWIENKKVWQVAAGVLWVMTLVVFGVLYFLQPPSSGSIKAKTQTSTTVQSRVSSQGTGSQGMMMLSPAEVQKHNSSSDCWIIIDSKVYDLTSYLGAHPGGSGPITPYCGEDGTNAFATKDRTRAQSHSSYATDLLNSYYIGDVGSQTTTQTTQGTKSNPQGSTSQYNRGGDED